MPVGDDGETLEFSDATIKSLLATDPDVWARAVHSDTDEIWESLGKVALYARLSYLAWAEVTPLHAAVWSRYANEPPVAVEQIEYLEVEKLEAPEIEKPKPKKKRLSTGELPVILAKVEGGFVVKCSGCGAASEPKPYKWQALDETVECDCWG
jgi:hypothetical protein